MTSSQYSFGGISTRLQMILLLSYTWCVHSAINSLEAHYQKSSKRKKQKKTFKNVFKQKKTKKNRKKQKKTKKNKKKQKKANAKNKKKQKKTKKNKKNQIASSTGRWLFTEKRCFEKRTFRISSRAKSKLCASSTRKLYPCIRSTNAWIIQVSDPS